MPRKKTQQPKPDQEFRLEDGTPVEVRGYDNWEIGRGQHKNLAYNKKRDQVLDLTAKDYLTNDGRRTPKKDYLKSAKSFVDQCELWGLIPEDLDDVSSFRKTLYRDVCRHIEIFEKAIKAKNTGNHN